ncbi:outer membrane protein [Vibrio hepatarius]|uniref:outer membrane protein n=1 Tax=Vibrio hepatarius TaxID=171383 RepID=UPI0037370FA0
MKKSIITLSIIASTLSGAAFAHNGFYIGAAYSKMGYSDLLTGIEKTDTRNGYSVNAGYDFAFGNFFVLGAELEYKDLGGMTGTFIQPSWSYTLDMTSVGVNVMPKMYFGDKFNIYAKAGLHTFSIDQTVTTTSKLSQSDSDSSMVWGLGLGYDFTPHISAQTTYEVVNTDAGSIGSANVGLRYKF